MSIKTILVSIAAAALLCSCAEEYGYGYGPDVAVAYNGYYDDYYGPIYDGYWEGDAFYYRPSAGGSFRRDEGQHFRHEAASGFHPVRGTAHKPRGERHHQG